MDASIPSPPLPRLLRERPALRGFTIIRGADELAAQMLNVAVGWYVYSATRNPMSLAYVGLAQFLPNIALVLIAGHAADRFDRRKIIGLSLLVQALCLAALAAWSASAPPAVGAVYALLVIVGTARGNSSSFTTCGSVADIAGAAKVRAVPTMTSSAYTVPTAGGALAGHAARATRHKA